jgi:F-type H+-transporting ATPase subunit b
MARRTASLALLALMTLALAGGTVLAAAAAPPELEHAAPGQEAAGHAESESNLFAGDLGNAIWTLVIFLLAVFLLGRFAWGPLLSTLQERERFIRDSLAQAKADREAAEARLAEYTHKLEEARAEATEIVDEGRRDGEVVKAKIEGEARAEATKLIERAKREIDVAKKTAIRELYATSARLATEVAARLIKREVKAADHERLIGEAIDDLGRQDLN